MGSDMPSGFETRGPLVVRLSGGYEERAEAVLARLARPGQAGSQVSTGRGPTRWSVFSAVGEA